MKVKKDSKPKITVYKPVESTSELIFTDRFNHSVSRADTNSTYNEYEAGFKEEMLRGIPPVIDDTKLRYGIAPKLQPLTKSKEEADKFMSDLSSDIDKAITEAEAQVQAEAEAQALAEAQAKAQAEAINNGNIGGNPDVK